MGSGIDLNEGQYEIYIKVRASHELRVEGNSTN